MRKRIAYFNTIPNGYGIAYPCSDTLQYICYPIPINLIMRWLMKTYLRIVAGWFPMKYEEDLYKAERKGYERGYKNAKTHYEIMDEIMDKEALKGLLNEIQSLKKTQ